MQSTSLYFNAKVKVVFSFSSSFSSSKNPLFYRTPCNTNEIAVIGGGRKEKENGQGACRRCILQFIKGRE